MLSTEQRAPRSGRRAGATDTRGAILAAARARFGAHGYERTTIRGVAADADVDPALVLHYFDSKRGLFEAALAPPADPEVVVPQLLAGPREQLGERMARFGLGLWSRPESRDVMVGLLRAAASDPQAAAAARRGVGRIFGMLARGAGADRPELRAGLAASQAVGMAIVRYVVRLEPLASAGDEQVIAAVAPTLQRYLTGELGPGEDAERPPRAREAGG